MASKYYCKHLNIDLRNKIETGLNNGDNFKIIADSVFKDPSTIGKEVKKNRTALATSGYGYSNIKICTKTSKPPYVCNACSKKKCCHYQKYYYRALDAQASYKETLINFRLGIDLTSEEFNKLRC